MIYSKLQYIFGTVNEMLRFAEAKNALMLTLQGVGLITLLQVLLRETELHLTIQIYLVSCLLFLATGLIISLLSFFPIMDNKIGGLTSCEIDHEKDNLMFYGDIAKCTYEDYLDTIRNCYCSGGEELSKCEEDLVHSILISSQIACRKYNYFKVSLWLILMALLTPVAGVVLLIVYHVKSKLK